MNVNPTKVNELVKIFVTLNEEYQNKAIASLLELSVEQKVAENYDNENKTNKKKDSPFLRKEAIKEQKRDEMHGLVKMLQMVSEMDAKQLAALTMAMEELEPGAFTQQEDIAITINSKQITMEEYIKQMFPDVDYASTKKFVKEGLDEVQKK